MDPRKVIILCGGRQVRWGSSEARKHAVLVPASHESENPLEVGEREPLIARTECMVCTMSYDDQMPPIERPVTIAAKDQFDFFEKRPDDVCLDFHVESDIGATVAYHIERNAGSARRLVFLMGDVYWTWADLTALIKADGELAVSTDYWDTFGFSFHTNDGAGLLAPIRAWGKAKGFLKTLGVFGTEYDALVAKTWTQDFDIDFEHIQFLHGISKNKLFRKTPGQVELRRALRRRVRESR